MFSKNPLHNYVTREKPRKWQYLRVTWRAAFVIQGTNTGEELRFPRSRDLLQKNQSTKKAHDTQRLGPEVEVQQHTDAQIGFENTLCPKNRVKRYAT